MATISFKCPNCGGELLFDPPSQKYKCPYCASDFTQEQMDSLAADGTAQAQEEAPQDTYGQEEQAPSDAPEQPGDGQGGVIYHCPSCGSEIVTDETTAATFCYYCHNPVVLSGRLEGSYLPDRIIPFQYGKDQAKAAFSDFIRSKKFVPASFYDGDQMDKLTGVYYPYWVYDTTVRGSLQARGNTVRKWVSGNEEISEISTYEVVRGGAATLRNMTANALRKSNRQLVENVQPYELSSAKPFNMSYLSGFVAEKRDMETEEFAPAFRRQSEDYTRNMMLQTAGGYTGLTVQNAHFSPESEHWSYMLLPVWVLTYSQNGQLYYFAMNGQTGRICGKLPVDKKKLLLYSALVFAAAFVLALAGGYFI